MAAGQDVDGGADELPPRWALFCAEYARDFNARAAAVRAGYAKASAKQAAFRMLADGRVQARLSRDLRRRLDRVEVSADRIVAELARIAFADIGDFVSIDADGSAIVDLGKVPAGGFAAVAEITQDVFTEGRGEAARAVRRTRFKLHDKLAALTKLGQYLRLFSERSEAPAAEESARPETAGDVEIARRIAFVLARAARDPAALPRPGTAAATSLERPTTDRRHPAT